MAKELNVLAISYAKRALEEGSREQQRMQTYSGTLDIFTVIVFTRKKDGLPTSYFSGNLAIYGTNTYTRLGMLIRAYFMGRKIIKETQKRWTVSSQDPFTASLIGYALAHAKNCIHQVQVHGDPFSPQAQKSPIQRMWNIFGMHVLYTASTIRTVSVRAKQSLIDRHIPSKNITVLPIQPDIASFLSVGEYRQYHQNGTCTFLYVGRLSPEKNIENIIEAFTLAYQQNQLMQLQILGEGVLLESLQTLVRKRGMTQVITFLSWTDNVAQAMAQVDVLVLSSRHEGYGLVLVEAMASGLPIITTDVGCVGEMVFSERHALVIPQDDTSAYAQALLQMTSDSVLRKEYGVRAHTDMKQSVLTKEQYLKNWRDTFVG